MGPFIELGFRLQLVEVIVIYGWITSNVYKHCLVMVAIQSDQLSNCRSRTTG